jgi:hypothetical protein
MNKHLVCVDCKIEYATLGNFLNHTCQKKEPIIVNTISELNKSIVTADNRVVCSKCAMPFDGLVNQLSHKCPDNGETPQTNGYHTIEIQKGVYGEFSKVKEEVAEVEDAISQGNKIMTLVELSDLYGAIEAYVDRHHGIAMKDLATMSLATKRAFVNGKRKNSDATN